MIVRFPVPFTCPASVRPHLEKVFEGEYDVPIYAAGPRILDLGANCGAFAVWASHRWPGSTITCYEPHPKTFEFLESNTEAYPEIVVHNYAIGTPGMRPLFEGKENCGESSLYHMPHYNPAPVGQHIEVVSPLELPEADIIKIDTEGCEVEILRPLIEDGRSFDAVLLEWHCHEHRREIDELLKDYLLIGSEVFHPIGRGLAKYINKEFMK